MSVRRQVHSGANLLDLRRRLEDCHIRIFAESCTTSQTTETSANDDDLQRFGGTVRDTISMPIDLIRGSGEWVRSKFGGGILGNDW